MGKKRTLPHEKAESSTTTTEEKVVEDKVVEEKQTETTPAQLEAKLTVPIGISPNGDYEGDQARCGKVRFEERGGLHINSQLDAENAITFLRIRNGLRERNARLANGRPVHTNVDALKWMMEQVEI